jgi:hypothetical protein
MRKMKKMYKDRSGVSNSRENVSVRVSVCECVCLSENSESSRKVLGR